MPNTENINFLISAMRLGHEAFSTRRASLVSLGFNMLDFEQHRVSDQSGRECSTTACIGGWAYAAASDWQLPLLFASEEFRKAREFLGITYEQADDLFFAEFSHNGLDLPRDWFTAISLETAIAVLEHLRDTNEVDWVTALAKQFAPDSSESPK